MISLKSAASGQTSGQIVSPRSNALLWARENTASGNTPGARPEKEGSGRYAVQAEAMFKKVCVHVYMCVYLYYLHKYTYMWRAKMHR